MARRGAPPTTQPCGQNSISVIEALGMSNSCCHGLRGSIPSAHMSVASIVPAWDTTATRCPGCRATTSSWKSATLWANSASVTPSVPAWSGCHASRSGLPGAMFRRPGLPGSRQASRRPRPSGQYGRLSPLRSQASERGGCCRRREGRVRCGGRWRRLKPGGVQARSVEGRGRCVATRRRRAGRGGRLAGLSPGSCFRRRLSVKTRRSR